MADIVDAATRSRMMSGIRGRNTKPELVVRRALHAAGFRYRLHARDLPGVPDIVLPRYNALIFVNGCFWHGHDCHLFKWPQTRQEFWRKKITGNRVNDARNLEALKAAGWRIAVVWECALRGANRNDPAVIRRLVRWLRSNRSQHEERG